MDDADISNSHLILQVHFIKHMFMEHLLYIMHCDMTCE